MHENSITDGFNIDEPAVFISWDTDEKELQNLLGGHGLRKIKDGYYCISCKSLGGLQHELGFHFEKNENIDERNNRHTKSSGRIRERVESGYNPVREGKLREFEFFRKEYPDLKDSFREFQDCFEKAFGKPAHSRQEDMGFTYNEWEFEDIGIYHYVIDRFGPEEHVSIKKV